MENKGQKFTNYNNNNINESNQIYNLYYNYYPNKRMPSPMIKHQKPAIKSKHIQPSRYRAPSPIISPNLDISNFIKKY